VGKVILWIVIVFAVLFGLRLLNAAKARRRNNAQQGAASQPPPSEAMVRCVRCGVYLPRADAQPAGNGFSCGDPKCAQPR
jgi:hypothetical protein